MDEYKDDEYIDINQRIDDAEDMIDELADFGKHVYNWLHVLEKRLIALETISKDQPEIPYPDTWLPD